jgi:hypothetical protein
MIAGAECVINQRFDHIDANQSVLICRLITMRTVPLRDEFFFGKYSMSDGHWFGDDGIVQ